MNARRLALIAVSVTLAAPSAQAGFFESLYGAFYVASTPSGGPVGFTSSGARVNGSRLGRVRVVPNRLGDGWRFEFDRAFGPDQFGRPEVFDLGNLELQLQGSTATTAEFTTRGIPQVEFQSSINSLNYTLRGVTGGQDFELDGVLDLFSTVDINPLGFYDLSVNVANQNSELVLEGLGAEGEFDTDYNIGPISVRGNIFFDAVVATLASFGVDVSGIVGVFPDSPIDRIAEEIQASMQKQVDELQQRLIAPDGAQTAIAGLAWSLDESLTGSGAAIGAEPLGPPPASPAPVPEPAALLSLALGGLLLRRR